MMSKGYHFDIILISIKKHQPLIREFGADASLRRF